ncbi:MAG TPA: hypothetical protein VGM95_00830 [Lactobacillaceae bacterium]
MMRYLKQAFYQNLGLIIGFEIVILANIWRFEWLTDEQSHKMMWMVPVSIVLYSLLVIAVYGFGEFFGTRNWHYRAGLKKLGIALMALTSISFVVIVLRGYSLWHLLWLYPLFWTLDSALQEEKYLPRYRWQKEMN